MVEQAADHLDAALAQQASRRSVQPKSSWSGRSGANRLPQDRIAHRLDAEAAIRSISVWRATMAGLVGLVAPGSSSRTIVHSGPPHKCSGLRVAAASSVPGARLNWLDRPSRARSRRFRPRPSPASRTPCGPAQSMGQARNRRQRNDPAPFRKMGGASAALRRNRAINGRLTVRPPRASGATE